VGGDYGDSGEVSGRKGTRAMKMREVFIRLRSLFRSERMDRELNEELASHVETHTADNLRAGMSAEEARRVALISLGGVEQTKEIYRDGRGVGWMENLLRDVRFALRMLGKNPGFTLVVVLTLALGIGANTAIFSVVNSVLLRSLPFPKASELVYISSRSTMFDFPNLGVSLPDVADVRTSATHFSAISATQFSGWTELAGDGKPERVEGTNVGEDFFSILGIRPIYGRTFTAADMREGTRSVVIGTALWHEKFGGDPGAIGKSLTLDGEAHTIIGVVPQLPALDFATDSKVWMPFVPSKEDTAARENHNSAVVARLRPGSTVAQAENELQVISARLAASYPDADKGWSIHADPLKHALLGDAQTPLATLFCAVGLVLLIACANVSNLFLTRGWSRHREFAIRSAMGATRGALLRQLGVECVLVAAAGGACAFLISIWMVQGLATILPSDIPRLAELRVEISVGWFTLGISLLAALLSGLAPTLLSSRQNLGVAIKVSGGGGVVESSRGGHNTLRQVLVVAEVALAVILLIGATLALRSFDALLKTDLGFRTDHLVTLKLDFPKFRFAKSEQAIEFVRQILGETRGIPGVTATSASLSFPLSHEVTEMTFGTGEPGEDNKAGSKMAVLNQVTPNYFGTMGIVLIEGRDFTEDDTKSGAPVFIVNEALARKFFGSTHVVGKRIATNLREGKPTWNEIVGVARDVREASPGVAAKPEIYSPFYRAEETSGVYVIVRSKTAPLPIATAAQERIWRIDKNQPITAIATVEARIAESTQTPRSQSVLLGIFGGIGFALSLIGVYGVMSYLVSQQSREIGIRMALGAEVGQILRSVMAHASKLTLIGVFIGVGCGLVLTRFMRSVLAGVSATDPLAFVGVAVAVTVVALAACFLPARRAARVDPVIALRYE
jgi:predicted permease